MELPVGAFIREGLKKNVPDNARKLLESNVEDEERHDLAHWDIYADALGVNDKDENEGKLLRDAWIAITLTTQLQKLWSQNGPSSLFYSLSLGLMGMLLFAQYLPISPGTSRSMLERILLYVAELGLRPSPSLDKLRKATINWVLQPLGINTTDKYLDKKFWLDASDRLMYEGKAPRVF